MGSSLYRITVRTVRASAMSLTEFRSKEHRSALLKESGRAHDVLQAAAVIKIQALEYAFRLPIIGIIYRIIERKLVF